MLQYVRTAWTRTEPMHSRSQIRIETLYGPDEATRTRLESPTAVGSSEWQARCDNGGVDNNGDDWCAGACEAGHAMEKRGADEQASHVPKEE